MNVEPKTATRRRRSEKEHSNAETNNAKIRDEGGLESDRVGEEETNGGPVGLSRQVLVNGRWVTITGDDAEFFNFVKVISEINEMMTLPKAEQGESDATEMYCMVMGRTHYTSDGRNCRSCEIHSG